MDCLKTKEVFYFKFFFKLFTLYWGIASLGAQLVKNPDNAGDPGLIPGSGRSPEEGNGYPLQYSCLENAIDRGAWWAPGGPWVAKSQTQLSN